MNGISHKQAMKWIDRRQDGLLKGNQQSLLDEHLNSCDSCRLYSEEVEQLASRLNNEFQTLWQDDPGPSRNIVANVMAKAKEFPAAKRFSSGLSLAGGLVVLVLLGVVINFFVSQMRDSAPVANGTEVVSSFPAAEDRLLAFASNQNGNAEIYTMQADGSGLTNITNNPAYDGFPHWSPDGKQIAFESDRDGSNQIYLMDADGSNVTQLTHGGDANGFLGGSINTPWSPDGSKLIVSQNTINDEKHQFYVMDVATKNTIPLTKEAGRYFSPSWSPDGEHIAFTSNETQGNQSVFFQLYIADSQGTQLTNITQNLPENQSASLADYYWSPDGTSITFVSSSQSGESTVYKAGLDGARVQLTSTNQQILDWWNGIALQTDLPQKVEQTSWSFLRADGSQSSIQTCQSNDPVAYALKRSVDGILAFGTKCSPTGWMLYAANPDGTAVHELLTSPLDARYDSLFQMTWSPDDHFLAFATYDEEQFGITDMFILNAKDPFVQPLKMENSSDPSWQPIVNENLVKEKSPAKLAIDSQSCKPAEGESVPTELYGLDVIQNTSLTDGDFTYDFWLYCDPTLKPEDPEHLSAIAGLGIYSSWSYTGPQVDGGYQFHYAFDPGEPFGETGTDGTLYNASAKEKDGIYLSESRIRETIQQGLPIQFSVIVESSLGQNGAVLSFALEPTEDGVRIADTRTEHLRNIADDRMIAFTAIGDNGNSDIFTIHPDGSGLLNLTDSPAKEWGKAWSPDGTRLAFVSDQEGKESIVSMNADGSNVTTLTDAPGSYGILLWSPDGTRLAYSLQDPDGKTANIYVMDANGQNQRRLTDRHPGPDNVVVGAEEWSPDGQYIYYSDFLAPGQSYIIKLDVESGESTIITGKMFELPSYITVNKDGSIMYLVRCTENAADFCLQAKSINQDGTGEEMHETMQIQQVCSSKWGVSSFYFGAEWFFDRSKIVFAFACRDGVHLYIANADGSDFKPLTSQPVLYKDMGLNRSSFELLPDGQSIVFLAPLDIDQTKGVYALNVQDALQNPELLPTRLNISASQLGDLAWQPTGNSELVKKETNPIPDSIRDIQALAGFEILMPAYLPRGYSFDRATYDPETQEAILSFVSSAEDVNKMGTIVIREKLGEHPKGSGLPVIATLVPVAGAAGAYSDGAWIYDSAGITTPRWVQGQGYNLRWQKNGMSFTIDFIGGELTPPVGLDELTAIANSMESHSISIQQTPTPEPVETSSYNDLVAFTSAMENGNLDIYTMRPDHSELVNLTKNPAHDVNPVWSPDGKRIAFESDRNGNPHIYLMNADGSGVTQLTRSDGGDRLGREISSVWSRDGSKLIFMGFNDQWDTYMVNADGSGLTRLPEVGQSAGMDIQARWSPDGRHVGFISSNTEALRIHVIDAESKSLDTITDLLPEDEVLANSNYHWSPDGKSLYFTAYRQVEEGQFRWTAYEADLAANRLIEKGTSSTPMEDWWDGTAFITGFGGGNTLTWLPPDGTYNTLNFPENCEIPDSRNLAYGLLSKRSPSGNLLIAVTCPNKDLWFYWANPDGTAVKQLLSSPVNLSPNNSLNDIAWSTDDGYAAVLMSVNGITYMYILDIQQALQSPTSLSEPVAIGGGDIYYNISWQPVP